MSVLKRQTTSTVAPRSLSQDLNRFFEWASGSPLGRDWSSFELDFPAISVKEKENAYVLSAELPGIEREDIQVTIQDNIVFVKGEKKEEKQEKGDNFVRQERSFGAFVRQVALPTTVDADRAEATLDKGVLTLQLPKLTKTTRRSIAIR